MELDTFRLSNLQHKFFKVMSQHHPRLVGVWDWQNRSVDVATFENAIKVMSHGEQIFARFLLSLWFGEDKETKFSFMEAADILDNSQRQFIAEWLIDPWWP
ncbi:hypothetical protein PSI19_16775 [Xenorhabdus khoisanae]|uniref:hypothetical protein n=1 Tax=Xenorhabdus TaxID=626 RepID=UPI0023598173|nr:hypothetical protein [Xenorhabdus khoisanae]MDC9615493.1 hypothetical protein [Xenorhabdus khoisanae]